MTRETHTHRGHCQFCLRVHAIDTVTGLLAKHGYSVQYGMFRGDCLGSGMLSLHVERKYTDDLISQYRKDARIATRKLNALRAGKFHPIEAWSGEYETREETDRRGNKYINRYAHKMVPFAEAPALHQKDAVKRLANDYENCALRATRHADQMTEWAVKIFDGKVPAYPNEAFDNGDWKVGDTVRIGGKSSRGYTAVIEAIEDRAYRTRGWNRGNEVIMTPHGRLTRPAIEEKRSKDGWTTLREGRPEAVVWEPLRNIKRPSIAFVEELKKAGLV